MTPLAKSVIIVGDYVTVEYLDGEYVRMHKNNFIAPLCHPDFLDAEIIDDGHTLRMGSYEADTLYMYEQYFEGSIE